MNDEQLKEQFQVLRARLVPPPELVDRVAAAVAQEAADASVRESPSATDGNPILKHDSSASVRTDSTGPTGPRLDSTRPGRARPRDGRRPRGTRWIGIVGGGGLAAFMAVAMVVSGVLPGSGSPAVNPWPAPVVVSDHPGRTAPAQPGVADPTAYADVYAALVATSNTGRAADAGWASATGGDTSVGSAPASTANAADGAMESAGGAASSSNASATNTQVAGIDEGDIVKTDGSYLYVAHQRRVAIVVGAGADTHEVAAIDVSGLTAGDEVTTGPVVDLMIQGDRLIVLTHGFEADFDQWASGSPTWISMEASSLKAAIYDIADPTAPRHITTLSQSGSYVDSRLSDGVLYLVSNQIVSPAKVDPGVPATFVPEVGQGSTVAPVPPDTIEILPGATEPTYSVVTSLDVTSGSRLGEQVVLGGTATVYMSQSNIYLSADRWSYNTDGQDEAKPLPGGAGSFVGGRTQLTRIGLNGGALAVEAQGELPGSLLNQFSLDEVDGNLRVVTAYGTTGSDSDPGWWKTVPALWVLDSQLAVVGSIPQLVSNEQVQSVRFAGSIAYVVTYEQVDPLFTIDLSDPTAPTVMSELKIPGFSSYLHPFGDNLLVGVGTDADSDGVIRGLKLTMFDVTDPYDVREITTARITGDETEVARDHKAGFFDVERGLIGFPVTAWPASIDAKPAGGSGGETPQIQWRYELYQWDGAQFTHLTTIDLVADMGVTSSEAATGAIDLTTRGVRIGDEFYIVTSQAVVAYDMTAYAKLTTVALSR
ncbi:MAG: beta-propeller domain-containing protein [Propionibacteriaceae bacterium]|jgi:uncharacterized secreted protein with C-terminal beta-propeller domain|nr:beta-propeller domain-containing protein [Propionibacteriaceae bacterium]